MSDWTVPGLVEEYKAGKLSRRRFVATLAAAGISMPMISAVLAACGSSSKSGEGSGAASRSGLATAAAPSQRAPALTADFQPTKRGGGGTLKVLWWQGPVLANAHLAAGTKDYDASRLTTEPLAAWNPDGELFPVLAAEIPSVENGSVGKDGKSVTWKLKKDVTWHDGKPFTAEDVVFTFEYASDPATAATSSGAYSNVSGIDKVDDYTVKVNFKDATPFWAVAFTSSFGHIFPKHLISQYKGAESRNSPYNLKPIGTGPYKIVDFRPGDIVLGEINDKYHVANRPFFDKIEMKGGGDAVSAARAVLQTGEYDYAWNMQVEADLLASLEKNGIGTVIVNVGSGTEHLQFNFADPWTEVEGEKSNPKSKHPILSDLKVRQALALAVNRKLINDELYGPTGAAASYFLFNPKKYLPEPPKQFEYNLQKANQLLDEAGWKRGAGGAREKDGRKFKLVYQTSENSVRQKTQQIIKKDWESLGIEVELKAINQNVFFGDSTNPDSYPYFATDIQMYNTGPSGPDPQSWMDQFVSKNANSKANKWAGRNPTRYQNPDYDKIWEAARIELDPVKRTELFRQMNQHLIDNAVIVPVNNRNGVAAAKKGLKGMDLSTWDSTFWKLPFWHRG